jgi:hypothetical protein
VGPSPRINQRYLSALSLAFFRTHLEGRSGFAPYLTGIYGRSLSQEPLKMDIVRSIETMELGQK